MNIAKIQKEFKIEIEYYEEILSTHIYAKKIAEKSNNKIIIANCQTGGIGTNGRNWYTGKRKKYSFNNYFTS